MILCKQHTQPGNQKSAAAGLKADHRYGKKCIWSAAIQFGLPGVYQFPGVYLTVGSAAEQFNCSAVFLVEKPKVKENSIREREVVAKCPVDYLNSRRIIREAVIDSSGNRNKANAKSNDKSHQSSI